MAKVDVRALLQHGIDDLMVETNTRFWVKRSSGPIQQVGDLLIWPSVVRVGSGMMEPVYGRICIRGDD